METKDKSNIDKEELREKKIAADDKAQIHVSSKLHVLTGQELTPEFLILCPVSLS